MLPNISADVIAKQKTLQPGSCVGFGGAFKIPMIVKLDLPNPLPYSSNCNVSACWDMKKQENFTQTSLEPINNTSLQQEIESLS